ncbi:MAG: ATP-binding cassette domain-containing protein [Steroidobacteraceae bacterium]
MIETTDLTRRYGALTAVDGISFRVEPGEVLGFLGPNGAGKSTTMRMLAGFIAPTSGTARICGHDVERDPLAAKRCLGYLPEGAPSYGEMSVRGFLGFIADLRGLEGNTRRLRLDYVIERLQLGQVLEQSIETLSKGFRRRVGLAQAVVHDPPVLILDEPTDGLDPNQKHEVRGLIADMARDKLIVVSTHILEEVGAVCTRAIIIARGRIVADDTPQGLAARSRYHDAVSFALDDIGAVDGIRDSLAALPGVVAVEVQERERRLTALPREPGPALLAAVTDWAAQQRVTLRDLRLESGRLDDVFRSITA